MKQKIFNIVFLARFIFAAVLLSGIAIFSYAGEQFDAKFAATVLTQQCVFDSAAKELKGKKLIISSFINKCEDENFDPSVLQDKLITAFGKAKWYKMIERERLDAALKEIKIDGSGLIDPANQKKLGKFLGADYMLVGTVSGDAGAITIDCRIIEIETGEIIITADYPNDFEAKVPEKIPAIEPVKPAPPVQEPVVTEEEITTHLISWTSSEITVSNTAMVRPQAMADSVRWLVEQKILGDAKDVYAIWKPEIEQRIYASSDKFVTEIIPRDDAYYLKINLTQVFRELVGIIFGKVTPRVAVMTKETVARRIVPDPAVQTVVAAALNSYRFQMVDPDQAAAALLREAILQADAGDDKAVNLVKRSAGELQADIFALGDSFAEQRTNNDGFDARVEYRITEGATARLIASINQSLSLTRADEPKLDPMGSVMAKKALQVCAEKTIIRMASEMLKAFGTPVFRVRIWKINDFDKFDLIQTNLKNALPGCVISSPNVDFRSTNSASFSIRTKRDAREVAAALQKIAGAALNITSIDCRSITCDLQ